jgi:hypothetical protein
MSFFVLLPQYQFYICILLKLGIGGVIDLEKREMLDEAIKEVDTVPNTHYIFLQDKNGDCIMYFDGH